MRIVPLRESHEQEYRRFFHSASTGFTGVAATDRTAGNRIDFE
jgi:hypothetical protein